MKRAVLVLAAAIALAAGTAAQGQQQSEKQEKAASCPCFVDADNDGVCDNRGFRGQGRRMRGRGMMRGTGAGGGAGMAFGPNGQSLVDITATVTGQEPQAVLQALKSGKTFAEIAGSSLDALKQQVLSERQQAMSAAVSEGRLSQGQADAMVARMTEHLDARLEGAPPLGRGPGRGFGRPWGGPKR
jgi:hypothetical protein